MNTIFSPNHRTGQQPQAHGLQSMGLAPRHRYARRRPMRRQHNRRGALLLVCLSLLVLFAVIGTTFVLISGQYRRAARSEARLERYGDDPSQNAPQELLDEAFMQLARGTTNANSSLQYHDLLGDMYGHGSLEGEIAMNMTLGPGNFLAGGQFVQLPSIDASGLVAQAKVNGYLNGQLLTFLDGPLRGVSTRIVGYEYTTTPSELGNLRVMAFDGWTQASLISAWNGFIAQSSARFVINGRPFNGTGFGYNPADTTPNDGVLSQTDADGDHPLALAPHFRYSSPGNSIPVQGGANEDYDAPDPQNMVLAYVTPGATSSRQIMPSFHRHDLVNYWLTAKSVNWSALTSTSPPKERELVRQIMLRPLHTDHPNFTGSNPNFHPVNGPWDIDNDGDGVPDSVWIDLGFPAETAADGRQFKPLFAFLCLDLDGRLNVNAHGNLAQTNATYSQAISGYFAGGSNSLTLSRGLGFGPADINLLPLFKSSTSNEAIAYTRLLGGDGTGNVLGRYCNDRLPPTDRLPGVPGTEELLSYTKQIHLPNPIYSNRLSSWATPPDLWGRGAVALDVRGTPLFMNMSLAGETIDDPYDIDFNRRRSRSISNDDALYTVYELERLMRPFDIDGAGLPRRLEDRLAPRNSGDVAFPGDPNVRHLVTTDSYDPPAFIGRPTREKSTTAFTGNILDWINRQANATLTADQIVFLVAPEVLSGEKMDINRPFGNGRDDQAASAAGTSGKGIVDEPGELLNGNPEPMFADAADTGLQSSEATTFVSRNGSVQADIVNSGTTPTTAAEAYTNGVLARQAMARHLYVLMMLLKDGNRIDFDFDASGSTDDAEMATGLAQWAINVVDFIDRDSIMSAFEVDLQPFVDNDSNPANGTWDVDGDLSTNEGAWRGFVWGCERPELLITETLAFHDRRTEDLDNEQPEAGQQARKTGTDPDDDTDFDQRLRPSGSFFVELYNPWRTAYSTVLSSADRPATAESAGEFYTVDETQTESEGVYLNGTASDGTPVWRLAVVKTADRAKQPDNPNPADQLAENDIERHVYFTQPPGAADNKKFYPSNTPAPIRPGRYAVVGSAGIKGDGITPVGRTATGTDPVDYRNHRQIRLVMNASADTNQVEVLNNSSTPAEPAVADIKPIVAVMVDQPRSLNISEPISGYAVNDPIGAPFNGSGANGEGEYTKPWDIPLDDKHAGPDPDSPYAAVKSPGTTPHFRVVHLQRLANPLLPWNADTNPYLTIDSMAVDLTVFNGATSDTEPNLTPLPDPPSFATLQRGEDPTNSGMINNLWSHEQDDADAKATAAIGGTQHYFNHNLFHTLGYLNKDYHPMYTSNAGANPPPGGLNTYRGEPSQTPFPWFTWKNSPLVSPHELMLVPKSRPSRLLVEYAVGPETNPYAAEPPRHLINFFDKSANSGQLYRLFDFLRVPSPFVGTETWLNPQMFSSTPSGPTNTGTDGFHPPFNRVSEMRDPGKVNINTIASQLIWQGLLNGHAGPTWQEFVNSRRGYGDDANPILVDPNQPTIFSNPFRSANSAMLTLPNTTARADIDVTLMRPHAVSNTTQPLFGFYPTTSDAYNDPARNPYFRYAELNRISNLVTTRSNVYAVWVTVGYFEVQAGAVDDVHPDGYRLGQELGADTGEITRHRGFYLFDRTLPVGYLPGQNLNVENAILLKRFIE